MIHIVGDLREIRCDAGGCDARRLQGEGSAREARDAAARRGWTHGMHPRVDRTLDCCPECSKKMVEKAETSA